jgi:hypothetical protein
VRRSTSTARSRTQVVCGPRGCFCGQSYNISHPLHLTHSHTQVSAPELSSGRTQEEGGGHVGVRRSTSTARSCTQVVCGPRGCFCGQSYGVVCLVWGRNGEGADRTREPLDVGERRGGEGGGGATATRMCADQRAPSGAAGR